jgi:heme-degrading monooxygenase HmoA
MVIVLIRTRLRADADLASYGTLNERMDALVREIPGYIDAKGYTSSDGDEVSMIRFESQDALRAWRDHPEHREVQALGKSQFYAAYRVEVCEVVRAYAFEA